MSRPIDGDGTIRYSTGRPGRENAPAVADPPARPITPGSSAAAMVATAKRRAQWLRILSTNVIEANPSIFRLPRNTLTPPAIDDRHGTAAFSSLRCRARSPERTVKFQLSQTSKTCDQHLRKSETSMRRVGRALRLPRNKSDATFILCPFRVRIPWSLPRTNAVGCRSWRGPARPRAVGCRWTTGFRPAMRSWPRKAIKALKMDRLCERLAVTKAASIGISPIWPPIAPGLCSRGASCATKTAVISTR